MFGSILHGVHLKWQVIWVLPRCCWLAEPRPVSCRATRSINQTDIVHKSGSQRKNSASIEHFVETWHVQVDAGNLHDATPLMLAAEGGHKAIWIALKVTLGFQPWKWIATGQAMVALLIQHQAMVEKRNKEGSTALLLAQHYQHRHVPWCQFFAYTPAK